MKSYPFARRQRFLALLLSTLLTLSACAAPEPTAAPTRRAPTAMPTPTISTASAAVPATRPKDTYQHPTGAFSVRSFLPLVEEGSDYALFGDDISVIMAFFTNVSGRLTDSNVLDAGAQLLDQVMVQAGVLDDYALWDEYYAADNGWVLYFDWSSADQTGEGDLLVVQDGTTAYGMALFSDDYELVEDDWWSTIASFVPRSGENLTAETASSPASGSSDSGFRPEVDGFSFENYTSWEALTDLTAAEVYRMFGDQACSSIKNGSCILTPPARQWMRQMNSYMANGHCEGMAVLSNLMYYGQVDPAAFGGDTTHDLEFENEALQREIAYWWVTQATWPASSVLINDSPAEVLDALMGTLSQGRQASEWWTLGIYKDDHSDGHAVTPIAVVDKGNDQYDILIYDNIYPDLIRTIEVDRAANTWRYEISANPREQFDLYEGDDSTDTLEVMAISPRLGQQDCEFCSGQMPSGIGSRRGGAASYLEIWLEGGADLLIEDEDGQRIGFSAGEFINEITDATTDSYRFSSVWDLDQEPVYRLPAGKLYSVDVDGTRLESATSSAVSLIGPGFFLYIDDLLLDPGETDTLLFGMDDDVFGLNYLTAYAESPALTLGMETDAADYAFTVQATEIIGEEDSFYVFADRTDNTFSVDASDNTDPLTLDLYLARFDDEGEHYFGSTGFVLEAGSTAYLSYEDWDEAAGVLTVYVDNNGDGQTDETLELPDSSEEYDWSVE